MNNAYVMSAELEKEYRNQAAVVTGGFAIALALAMLISWKLPSIELVQEDPPMMVALNFPPEPETPENGGGGGGNPVQAAGPAGVSDRVPPAPANAEESRDIDDNNDKEATEIAKPVNPKPTATKITEGKSVVKTEPKPVEVPAPRIPKAVAGKTLTGTGKGGGSQDDFNRPGGNGTGNGVGNGSGTGGGTGTGNGGGNGSGSGSGNGPKITRGDRKIVRYYSFEGDLDKAVIYANISVSPDGIGRFISISKGSSTSTNQYKEAIMQYLQNIKFDKADHESMLTVQFNFRVN